MSYLLLINNSSKHNFYADCTCCTFMWSKLYMIFLMGSVISSRPETGYSEFLLCIQKIMCLGNTTSFAFHFKLIVKNVMITNLLLKCAVYYKFVLYLPLFFIKPVRWHGVELKLIVFIYKNIIQTIDYLVHINHFL